MSEECLRIDQIEKKNIRETTKNEVKFLETQYKNKRKISLMFNYGLITAFILQTTYIAVTFSHAMAFNKSKPGVSAYILLGVLGILIYLFRKFLNNNGTYPVTFKFKGVYRSVRDDEYAAAKKVRFNHFFHPYQVEIPEHWLALGYLKEGKEYTFEGCPTELSFLRDTEDENYDFGALNIYEDEDNEDIDDTESENDEELDVCAVDYIYSVVSIDNKLSVDKEMQSGLDGLKWPLKYSLPKNLLLITLLIIHFFGIISVDSLVAWGKKRISGVTGIRHYNNTASFISSPPAQNQYFTIKNACIMSKTCCIKYLIGDINEFEKDFNILKTEIFERNNEIRRLANANSYRLKSSESWNIYTKIKDHPEFNEMKKAMLNQDENLTNLRNLPDKNRANEVLKRVFTSMAHKRKYMDKLYEAEASYINKKLADLLPKNSEIDISVESWSYYTLPNINITDLRLNWLNKRFSKITDIISDCRKEGSLSGVLLDYNDKIPYLKFEHITSKRPHLARYYQIKPYVESAVIIILIAAFLFFFIKHRKAKQYNKTLKEQLLKFYRI